MIKKVTQKNGRAANDAQKANFRLLKAAASNTEDVLRDYGNTWDGYDKNSADVMQHKYGKNEIPVRFEASIIRRLAEAFINPFTIVLMVLAAISFVTDVIMAEPGEKDATAVIIVSIMVFISGMLRFIQETRASRAAEQLKAMVKTTIAVQRKYVGKSEIPISDIVVGDIIYLAAGDMVPADVRILSAKDLFISQSSLTGESEPVEKFSHKWVGMESPLEVPNLAFMGSNVVSGSAAVVAIAVGEDTVFGNIAKDVTKKKSPTSFEKGVNSVSWLLIRFMMVMVPVVLFLNGFTKGDWMEAFLFALSVAVGLTPEMLPMIVSVNLARGASAMSRKKVIIKDLNSIQNLGAIDVLCTDKTGTLTQDRVVLEYSLDVQGQQDSRVLRHAFLNSYHQTGLRNLMDVAIVRHADEKEMTDLWKNYTKVDEIPFDFNRRRMSVVVADDKGKTQLITKGAIEEILSVCAFTEYERQVLPLTEELKAGILDTVQKYNNDGMRVLGVAQKTNPSPVGSFSVADESDMVLLGYLAFLDPPKESATHAITALKEYGVNVKILTGDNDAVTRAVCRQVGIRIDNLLLGSDVEQMEDGALKTAVEKTNVFAKLSPSQKTRIVKVLRDNGHTVGFLGDGINDASAMKEADVGISVDTAVDIAKESANIILLEKDLTVLEQGIIEGRKTYANIIKYIKMTASSNFGNMFSVLAASAFLPFLPMLPIQLLMLNLIYDISCITIPWDNVDPDYLKQPRKWDAGSIGKFMLWIGPTSSVFDITTYLLLFFIICPAVAGGSFHALGPEGAALFIALFHAGWFVESLWTQTLVIHMIRTPLVPFIQSRASWQVTLLTTAGIAAGTLLPYTFLGKAIGLVPLPGIFFPWLILTVLLYMALATAMKKVFVRRYGELL